MFIFKVFAILLLLVSCASNSHHEPLSLSELVTANQAKLLHLTTGMGKNEVLALMKSTPASTRDGTVNNPWSVESFVDKANSQYEVLYYITRKNQPFTPIRKSLATEIVLKNGKVIGWGENASNQYRTQ